MKRYQFWLAACAVLAILAVAGAPALAQPKPISACGTTVSTAGSYVVTANLTAAGTSAPCIKITVAAVTIDLAGFVLTGKGGSPGISASAGPLAITNGFVNSFSVGINAPVTGVMVSDVDVESSQGAGAMLGDNAQVTDSNFAGNGTSGAGDGLDVGNNGRIYRCGFFSNKGNGVQSKGTSAVITTSRASGNTNDGFLTSGQSVLRNNTAGGNTGLGFDAAGIGNSFTANAASSNGSDGIGAVESTLVGNTASSNKGVGFEDAGENTFDGNTAFNNTLDGFLSFNLGAPSSFSTYNNNTATFNGRDGFDVTCPDNFVNVTALDNTSKNFSSFNSGCQLISVLAP